MTVGVLVGVLVGVEVGIAVGLLVAAGVLGLGVGVTSVKTSRTGLAFGSLASK